MAEHVHEIVNHRGHRLALLLVEAVGQALARFEACDFVVRRLSFHAHALKQRFLQLGLVGVFGAFGGFVDPTLGLCPGDVSGGHSREQGIARVLRGRGQDAEKRLLLRDVPIVRQNRRNGTPLVPTQVVDDHQKQRTSLRPGHRVRQPRGQHLVGHHGALFHACHPVFVVIFDEPRELVVRLGMLIFQNFQHAAVSRIAQREVPMAQPAVDLGPFLCVQPATQLHGQLAELPHVGRLGLLALNPSVVQDFLDRHQDLVGVHRLDQVVADFGTNRLLHDALLLALGDHDDGQLRPLGLDALKRLDAIQTWHVFVQEHDVVGVLVHPFKRFHPAVDSGHVVPLLVEEQHVGPEQFDFVVSPKNVWSCHARVCSSKTGRRKRSRHPYLATK